MSGGADRTDLDHRGAPAQRPHVTGKTDTSRRRPDVVPLTSRRARIVGGLCVLALAAAPWIFDAYTIATGSRMLSLALLAASVTLLTGIAGLPTLGQAAFFGIGAYTAALLARAGMTIGVVQLLAAVALAVVVAAVVGSVVVRSRGVTFLMLTLAVGELAHTAADGWRFIGGSDGLSGVPEVVPVWGLPPLTLEGLVFYYVLVVFLVVYLAMRMIVRSPFGLALRGIRDNEARMRATGYPVTRYLLSGYCVAAGVAGAAGALWTSVQQYVSPENLGFDVAAMALLAAVIGGLGSLWGACVGAALVVAIRDYLGNVLVGQGALLLGVMFICVVYLLPEGLGGIRFRRLTRWWRRRVRSATEST